MPRTLAALVSIFTVLCLTAGVVDAAPREVRIASHVSEVAPLHAQAKLFAAKVDERLPGQFEFKHFPGGQLGKETALIDNVQLGTLEMIIVASGVLKVDGKLGLFDLPWLFDNRAHVQRAMAAGLEQQIRERIEKKASVKVVGVYENGFRHVINSQRSIMVPDDISGMKIRISGGKFRQGVFESMGAVPTKVAWGETFTAMQTGVVDGAEAAIYGFYGQKHYEVQKHLSLTSHVYTPSFLIASTTFWKSLTPEQRKVFEEVGREITAEGYELAAGLESQYLGTMRKHLAVNDADLKAFQDKTRIVYATYTDKYGDAWLKIVDGSRR